MKLRRPEKKHFIHFGRITFWFLVGASLATFLISSFAFILFEKNYNNLVYPGVTVSGVDFSGKSENQVSQYFTDKNQGIKNTSFVFTYKDQIATSSAESLQFGYDNQLIAQQAISIGRSSDPLSNLSLIVQSYLNGISLPASYNFSQSNLQNLLSPLAVKINKVPVDALFQLQNGKVTAFRASSEGQNVDYDGIGSELLANAPKIIADSSIKIVNIPLQVKTLEPSITTDKVNNLGIKELIGTGTSLFQDSIPSRIFNITLASSRINGSLVAPGDTFSFDKALGDVSAFTGYKQAYVIQSGHTVLGDGGGVCQVSTTFFRALLNAGLPITDRTAHAYRVGYYEEDSPPGLDATIYVPTVDLKFKNDTGRYILVQTVVDPVTLRLTVYLYGTSDGRKVTMTTPVITNTTPAPQPLYQDDPNLPIGTLQQTDFAANGADVYFTRTVTKNGKVLYYDKFTSDYQPWQAVFLRGTKS